MIQPPHANADSLVYDLSWELEDMVSCCVSTIPIRLAASYCTPRQQERELTRLQRVNFAVNALNDGFSYEHELKSLLMSAAFGVPLDLAFGSVLADMKESAGGSGSLYIATDNITRPAHGDVHKGPFSTKNLVQWLADNDLATVYEGAILYKPRRNKRGLQICGTHRAVQTWSWTLRPTQTRKYVQKARKAFQEYFNEMVKQLPNSATATTWSL